MSSWVHRYSHVPKCCMVRVCCQRRIRSRRPAGARWARSGSKAAKGSKVVGRRSTSSPLPAACASTMQWPLDGVGDSVRWREEQNVLAKGSADDYPVFIGLCDGAVACVELGSVYSFCREHTEWTMAACDSARVYKLTAGIGARAMRRMRPALAHAHPRPCGLSPAERLRSPVTLAGSLPPASPWIVG